MREEVTLYFKKVLADAVLPTKAHTGLFEDAAFDLFYVGDSNLYILPQERKLVSTGLACIIPNGYWIKFHERSGLASKSGIQVLAGVIDSGYTNEWKVVLFNSGTEPCVIPSGKAVCQFTIEKVLPVVIAEIQPDQFDKYEAVRSRKELGFGSTDGNLVGPSSETLQSVMRNQPNPFPDDPPELRSFFNGTGPLPIECYEINR